MAASSGTHPFHPNMPWGAVTSEVTHTWGCFPGLEWGMLSQLGPPHSLRPKDSRLHPHRLAVQGAWAGSQDF